MDNNDSIVVTRDYKDNFSFKETTLNTLGQKYFGDIEISKLNVGLTGFTLEEIGNITEDSFNTAATFIKESFPNRAQIPESIYSHAAVFQLDNTFATAATCKFLIAIPKEDILRYATVNNNILYFYIDKNTQIIVEDIPFTLDYTIEVKAKKYQGEYIYSAQYVLDSINSISGVNDPYLKIRDMAQGYLLIEATLHQCERTLVYENIISNTKVNFPVIDVEYDGMLAGFDVFYKAPKDNSYTQLTKRITFTTPLKTPFCYYKQKDENKISISFTSRDAYFQPEFNSELIIRLYTTLGSDGCFDNYTGNNISFVTSTENYDYNASIAITATTLTASVNGSSALSLEALQNLTVEGFSTATELSTEDDVMTYFYNFKYRYGTEITVLKRRDDITERLFSSFLMLKDDDYIFPTNTLNLILTADDADINYKDEKYIIKPGHIITYKEDSSTDAVIDKSGMVYEKDKCDEIAKNNKFAYTNPFIISINKSPNLVGIYMNIINQNIDMDFISANDNLFIQFIINKLNIFRGLDGLDKYTFTLNLFPSIADSNGTETLEDIDSNLRVILAYEYNGIERGYTELTSVSNITDSTSILTYTGTVSTDDYITSTSTMKLTDAVNMTEDSEFAYIPINDVIVNIYTLYKTDGETNKFAKYDKTLDGYAITNVYNTKSNPVTFIRPMNMVRSTVTFDKTSDDKLQMKLSLMPLLKYSIVLSDRFSTFISRLYSQYDYLNDAISILRNNTNIDIKFCNTYGKSNNYIIGDNGELIDRVNLSIKFKIVPKIGSDEITLRRDLKLYIKSFIESVNTSDARNVYISNLIRGIENTFASVHHLKFMGINDYSTDYQTVGLRESNIDNLPKDERRNYVPEVLVIDEDDVHLSIEDE